MARLFVAAGMPAEVVAGLVAATTPVRMAVPGLRWVEPDTWHLTLAFLGSVPDELRAGLHAGLGLVAERHAPVEVELSGVGQFGSRVLWVGVAGELAPLAAQVRRAADQAGAAEVDQRPLRAHITLGWAREGRDADLRAAVDALSPSPPGPPGLPTARWTVERLALMRSELSARSRPPRYTTDLDWRLTGVRPGPPRH